jgi:hypothetical protein
MTATIHQLRPDYLQQAIIEAQTLYIELKNTPTHLFGEPELVEKMMRVVVLLQRHSEVKHETNPDAS